MDIKRSLKIRLELINKIIEEYKKKVIEDVEKEEMINATGDLLFMRDLKEQQLLLCKILDKEV